MAKTSVMIEGSAYRVTLEETPTVSHLVNKNRECSCGVMNCRAVTAVEEYLLNGGRRAPDPIPTCPICGSKTYRDTNWDSKYTHELGWRCEKGGLLHFLESKADRIKKNVARHPYIIPPVGDYKGVTKDEIFTWEQCREISERVFRETGYNPAA